jgi:transcriptional regulator with XRE-family HTH domain
MVSIPSALDVPIGEVVKAWREYRGLSVTEFAERAGIPKAYVSELEHLRIDRPGTKRMGELAAGLGINYWDLVQRRLPPETGDDGQVPAEMETPDVRRTGGFAFAAPLKPTACARETIAGDEERLLRQLSDQVDQMRRTLDALLVRKTGFRDDHVAP